MEISWTLTLCEKNGQQEVAQCLKLAAGLGIVMVTTAVLLGVVLTSVELRDGINRD